jgi:hypothetical protein
LGESINDSTIFNTSFYYPPEQQLAQIQTDSLPANSPDAVYGAAAVFTEATYMPNPVETNLYINYKLTRPAKVWFTLHNNAGIPLRQTAAQNLQEGYNNTTVNMSGLISGTYTLYVHVDDMVMQHVIVKK